MEQHGKSTQNRVVAILPARYKSVRLPGKLLLDLGGKPVILHTLAQVAKARNIDKVIVATDSVEISRVVEGAGGEVILTSGDHLSGTDRIAEAAEGLAGFDIVVNVQSDEPFIQPEMIERTVEVLETFPEADVATAYEVIDEVDQILNPNCVKAVVSKNGRCIYFSRSPVPYPRDEVLESGDLKSGLSVAEMRYKKHIGIYAYRRQFLIRFAKSEPTELEETESLEQLRALEMGAKIFACEVSGGGVGIDTAEDLAEARIAFEGID